MSLEASVVVRILVAAIGVILLAVDFLQYCRLKLKELFAFSWGVFALALIVFSVVPGLSGWSRALPANAWPAVLFFGVLLIFMFYTTSEAISELILKNQELAMQVSLLNCENDRVLRTLRKVTGEDIMEMR
jgi:hypothetical protein